MDPEQYCRFCADRKHADKMLNLKNDTEKYAKVLHQLQFMNINFLDVSEHNNLPKTVCLICYEAFNNAYQFLINLKNAQTFLNTLFCITKNVGPDTVPKTPENSQLLAKPVQAEMVPSELFDDVHCDTSVKLEWIEDDNSNDKQPSSFFQDEDDEDIQPLSLFKTEESNNITKEFSVHSILQAAAIDKPEELTFYAKELKKVKKKNIKFWDQYKWTCVHCGINFATLSLLKEHSREVHNKCYAYYCMDCQDNVIYKNVLAFIHHVRRHKKYLRKVCFFCDIHHEDIDTHTHTEHTHTNFCEQCGDSFNSAEDLEIHVQEYATGKSKKVRRKRGAPITTQELTCKICKKVYKNLNSLRDHQKLHVEDRKRNNICETCGKTFYSKGSLTSHIMIAHNNIKAYSCKICKKSFAFPNMLRKHVAVHTGSKPFSCETCGKCFRLKYQLNLHKIVHTDEMPHVCQYCSKAFRFRQILKNHERIHTGAKPYNCLSCIMEFSNWSNYNKHMKRKHGTNTAKKKITPEGSFPIDPNTGEIIRVNDQISEEWKNQILVPGKRGRKKIIKEEM